MAIEAGGWAFLMASLAVGFAALVLLPLQGFPGNLLPPLIFAGVPLLALRVLVGRHWTALFRRFGWREVGVMGLVATATMVGSVLGALLVRALGGVAPNPVTAAMQEMSAGAFLLRLLPTLPQLLGEELLTILPFLALFCFARRVLRLGRRAGILVALLGSSLIFAMAHLPTYDWHWAQCIGVIGTARVILTLAFIWTRNLWVSTGAHVLNDWTEFTLAFGIGHVPVGAG